MNRWFVALLPLVCFCGLLFGVSANTVVTNNVTISGAFIPSSDAVSVTVAPFYGLGPVLSASNIYYSPPSNNLKIPMSLTNGANDADSNAQVFVQFLSNESGYSGSNWSCYIELAGTNAGTNYDIPMADFGEGAVFNFNLVVVIPLLVATNSQGFMNVMAATSSNTGHPVALYTGFNGGLYGGYSNTNKLIQVNISMPNHTTYLAASDGVDTIQIFDGTKSLRRTAQTITVDYAVNAVDPNSAYLWFDIDNTADGPGGANPNDKMIKMKQVTSKEFTGVIDDSYLGSGNILSFMLQMDGVDYAYGSIYHLMNLASQDKYETILMHNVITRGSGELIYVKLPSKVMGMNGKIKIYSVSGDLVTTLLNGSLDRQVVTWDGNDKDNVQVSKGLYFIVFDFNDLKEVRKLFVK